MRKRLIFTAFLLLLGFTKAQALENGLARTPPMGWNSWNKFGCDVSEELIRGAADAVVNSGMKDAGYQYVVIDDCWQVSRDAEGDIVPDAKRFPSGMKALGDYIHSKGLKFGIYSDAGRGTCQNRPGSRGYEYQDARQYAAWGVDYLKYDWCNHDTQNSASSYATMRDALAKSGRPIVFSICEWGSTKPWLWAGEVGNLWRTTGDITDKWDAGEKKDDGNGVVQILDLQDGIESYAGPGHWNDPDMLEVGNGGMTEREYRAHFSLWCLMAAPLLAGNDLNHMSEATKAILTNKEVIAVDQDALGIQAKRVKKSDGLEIWVKQMSDGGRAIGLLNRTGSEAPIEVRWTDLGYPDKMSANIRNLWEHKTVAENQKGGYKVDVPSHGAVVLRVMPD